MFVVFGLNNSIKMELSSLAYMRLKKDFISTPIFFIEELSIYVPVRSGAAFPLYKQDFGGEKFGGPRPHYHFNHVVDCF